VRLNSLSSEVDDNSTVVDTLGESGSLTASTADQRSDSCQEFHRAQGPDNVVVSPQFQTPDPIHLGAPISDNDDGQIGESADFSQNLKAVYV